MKSEITVVTGREWHTSWGAYGLVKLYDPQAKTLTHHYETDQSETDWDETVKAGYQGKHGKWMTSHVTLHEGQLIYVEGADTYKDRPNHKARGWFRQNSAAPAVSITAPDYQGNSLEVNGALERLSCQEQKELNLPVIIRSSKWLEVARQAI